MISNIKNFSGKLFSLENVLNISDSIIYRKYVVFFIKNIQKFIIDTDL